MLNRRHIRLKVMQSLYSYFLAKDDNISVAERAMLKHIDEVIELKLVIISLLVELVRYADNFYEDRKTKYLPTQDDLNPNRRFVENELIVLICEDKGLMERASKVSGIWLNNDHDIVRKLFSELYKSELYTKYTSNKTKGVDVDQRFIVSVLNDIILNSTLVHHILEERSIYWIDDLPFIATIIIGQIKSQESMNPSVVFKDISDKDFAVGLFRETINNNQEYEKIIIKFARNWDIERIAIMDQLFLKMAFAEILTMPDLPVKVSINEYIEIAKYYSTAKSKLFINGLLDNFVKTYTIEGKIKKKGIGLV
ncbi:transcription antitermination factor NusB [Flavobacteriales bacterium]|nr:transcription antitermination factor NusB [Flavobacteriales bacterium]